MQLFIVIIVVCVAVVYLAWLGFNSVKGKDSKCGGCNAAKNTEKEGA